MDAGAFDRVAPPSASAFADPSRQFADMIAALRGPFAPPLPSVPAPLPISSPIPVPIPVPTPTPTPNFNFAAAPLGSYFPTLGLVPAAGAERATGGKMGGHGQGQGQGGWGWSWKMLLVVCVVVAVALGLGFAWMSWSASAASANASANASAKASGVPSGVPNSAPSEAFPAVLSQPAGFTRAQRAHHALEAADVLDLGFGQDEETWGEAAPVYALRPPAVRAALSGTLPGAFDYGQQDAHEQDEQEQQQQQQQQQEQHQEQDQDQGDDGVLTREFVERYRKQNLKHFKVLGLSEEEAEQYIRARLTQLHQAQVESQQRLPPLPSFPSRPLPRGVGAGPGPGPGQGPGYLNPEPSYGPGPSHGPSYGPGPSHGPSQGRATQARVGFNDTIRIDAAPTSDGDAGEGQAPSRDERGGRRSDKRDGGDGDDGNDDAFRRYRRAPLDDDDEEERGQSARRGGRRGGDGGRSAAEDAAAEFERRRAAQDEEFERARGRGVRSSGERTGGRESGRGGGREANRDDGAGDANFTLLD